MALIQLGAMITKISGKMGGTTFGTSASGSYAKNSGTPRKSITLAQQSKMALMGTTAQAWRELTQPQRDVFNAASPDYPYLNRVGEIKYYSGFAIYGQLRNNVVASSFSGPLIPIPLPKFSFTPLVFVEIADWFEDAYFDFNDGQAGIVYRLFLTRVSSVGISNPYKNFFYMSSAVPDIDGNVGISPAVAYISKWGYPALSGKLFWRVDAVQPSTGQIYKGLNSGVYSF